MTREARQTQKRLEGEILKLLKGRGAELYQYGTMNRRKCAFCKRYQDNRRLDNCSCCPIFIGNNRERCLSVWGGLRAIGSNMEFRPYDAIPGALAIYMWLEEL
jgi:hypothetical protein